MKIFIVVFIAVFVYGVMDGVMANPVKQRTQSVKRTKRDDYKYEIKLVFHNVIPNAFLNEISLAKNKIESMLTTHFPNRIKIPWGACGCFGVKWTCLNRVVKAKDLLIYVRIASIDGVGGTGARAGVCRIGRGFARVALIELDISDAYQLYNYNLLKDLFIHEMLHAVGVGTLWRQKGLVSSYYTYLGKEANTASSIYGVSPNALVENMGGSGSINSHWRESVYNNEMMTSIINFFGSRPISALTVGSLRDIGHRINDAFVPDYYSVNFKTEIENPETSKTKVIMKNQEHLIEPKEIKNNWLV
jgi:hypothetical protein